MNRLGRHVFRSRLNLKPSLHYSINARYASDEISKAEKIQEFLKEEGYSFDSSDVLVQSVDNVITSFSHYNLGLHKFTDFLLPIHYVQAGLDFCINILHLDCGFALVLSHTLFRLLTSKYFLQQEIDSEHQIKNVKDNLKKHKDAHVSHYVMPTDTPALPSDFSGAMESFRKKMNVMQLPEYFKLDRSNNMRTTYQLKQSQVRDMRRGASQLSSYDVATNYDQNESKRMNSWLTLYHVFTPTLKTEIYEPIKKSVGSMAGNGGRAATFMISMMAYRNL